MLICLKPGGFLVFTARYSYLGQYWYADVLGDLEKAGRVKAITSEAFFKYDQLNESVGKFTKTPVKVYVYQKTESDSVFASQQMQMKLKKNSGMSVSTVDSEYLQ